VGDVRRVSAKQVIPYAIALGLILLGTFLVIEMRPPELPRVQSPPPPQETAPATPFDPGPTVRRLKQDLSQQQNR
jgi:hypothetical protein